MLLLLVLALFLGWFGARLAARHGARAGLLDLAGERSSHVGVVPKGGGLGILAAFFLLCPMTGLAPAIWVPAVFLSLLSLAGDRAHIAPKLRLLAQFGAALPVGLSLTSQGGPWTPALVPLAMVYIVATANFYNFMDGINGIAGITGVVGFVLLGLTAAGQNDMSLTVAALVLAAACAGFLPNNVPRARVFMGDVGSVLLGFVHASLCLWLAEDFTMFFALAAGLFPFYADAVTTIAVRLRDGERITQAHRRHVYQLLANQGTIAHWKIATAYGAAQLVIGAAALGAVRFGPLGVALVYAAALGVFVAVNRRVRRALDVKGRSPR